MSWRQRCITLICSSSLHCRPLRNKMPVICRRPCTRTATKTCPYRRSHCRDRGLSINTEKKKKSRWFRKDPGVGKVAFISLWKEKYSAVTNLLSTKTCSEQFDTARRSRTEKDHYVFEKLDIFEFGFKNVQ